MNRLIRRITPPMKFHAATAICALTLSLSLSSAMADRLIMKNGQLLEGEILEETMVNVRLQSMTNTMTLPKSLISSIERSAPGEMPIKKARVALKNRNLEMAKQELQRAKEQGAAPELVEALEKEINSSSEALELEQYGTMVELARLSARRGEDSEALHKIRELLEDMDPESPNRKVLMDILCEYHLKRAEQYSDRVRIQNAVNELAEVIKIDPKRSQAYMDLADIYKKTSATHDKAISSYHLALQPGNDLTAQDVLRAKWELAELYRQSTTWREASYYYREVYKHNPQYNMQLRERLMAAFRAFARSIESSEPAISLMVVDEAINVSKDPDLMLMKGRLLSRLGRHSESNTILDELMTLDGRKDEIHYMKAQNFMAEGELLQGRESLRKEVEINPNHFRAQLELGDLALQRDDYDSAETYYKAAQRINPSDPDASLGLGKLYRRQAKEEDANKNTTEAKRLRKEATTYVTKVLAIEEENLEANLEMGRLLIDEEKLHEAKNFFTTVLDLVDKGSDPEEAERLVRLKADALIARGEINLLTAGPGTANKDFRSALETLPGYGQAYYSIGLAFRKKYNSSKQLPDLVTAEENLLKSRELSPENPQFALELGILYSQHLALADSSKEKEYLNKAVANWEDYIELGGANTGTVSRWIQEIKGGDQPS